MGELLIKTNPAWDFNSNLKNCYPKAEVIGSNPIHRAIPVRADRDQSVGEDRVYRDHQHYDPEWDLRYDHRSFQ